MPDSLVFVPGGALVLASLAVTFSGYGTHSSARVRLGNQLRYGGIAVFLVLPGIELVMIGLMSGPRWGQIILGLIFIGFGGLWIIGLTGIPRGPRT